MDNKINAATNKINKIGINKGAMNIKEKVASVFEIISFEKERNILSMTADPTAIK